MKGTIIAAAALFAATVSASDIYRGLGDGNPDLSARDRSPGDVAGMQPNVGDFVSRYHGWDEGSPDLFKGYGSQPRTRTFAPDIYKNLSSHPDLKY